MSQITLDELRALDSVTDSISAVQSGSWSVDANITNATLAVTQSGSWTVSVSGVVSVDDNGASLTVDGTVAATQSGAWSVDANITNATLAVTQSGTWTVGVNDFTIGGNSLVVNADGSLNVQGEVEIDDVSDSILVTKKSATSTSSLIVASGLANRRKITIQNLGAQDVYIDDTTATTDGIKIPKNSSASFFFAAGVDLACITSSGTADLRVLEEAQA